jgi:hypothetical protein
MQLLQEEEYANVSTRPREEIENRVDAELANEIQKYFENVAKQHEVWARHGSQWWLRV